MFFVTAMIYIPSHAITMKLSCQPIHSDLESDSYYDDSFYLHSHEPESTSRFLKRPLSLCEPFGTAHQEQALGMALRSEHQPANTPQLKFVYFFISHNIQKRIKKITSSMQNKDAALMKVAGTTIQ